MSLSEDVRPLLAARAAIDPNAARLLEMFARAYETLSEHSLERIGDDEMPRPGSPFSSTLDAARSLARAHGAVWSILLILPDAVRHRDL